MKTYQVELTYLYKAYTEVEASSEEHAIEIAKQDESIKEEFDCLYDAEASASD